MRDEVLVQFPVPSYSVKEKHGICQEDVVQFINLKEVSHILPRILKVEPLITLVGTMGVYFVGCQHQ